MRTNCIVYLLFLFLYVGCTTKDSDLNSFLNKTFPDLKEGEVLIIPGTGCSGCISDAEKSLDSLIRIKNHRIILSQIQSFKTLKNRFMEKNIDIRNKNVHVDTAEQFIKSSKSYSDLWAYPTRISIKNYKIVSIAKF